MLLSFSNNVFNQARGILKNNYVRILVYLVINAIVTCVYILLNVKRLNLTPLPVSIMGGALGMFLAFRNNSAYDRWWEARKVWEGIVNISRTFGRQVTTLATLQHANEKNEIELKAFHKELLYRQIAWANALRLQLRNSDSWEELKPFVSENEYVQLIQKQNLATQLIQKQAERSTEGLYKGYLEDFRHIQLDNTFTQMYELQGKAERLKNTVFPYYYNYFTRFFLRLFLFLLPFSLVGSLGWATIPLGTAISFVFSILEKSGTVTETPFENRAADTPMSSLCNTIEIDLREQLGETELPAKMLPEQTNYGVVFIK